MSIHLSVVMPVYNERHLVAESIRRVLAVDDPAVSRLDLILVDDGSTDGTRAILREIAAKHSESVSYVEHETNRGKGAAVATGVKLAEGAVTIIQDADLEYNPADFGIMLVPFLREGADAVFGSRFMPREYRKVLYYRHTLGNRLLTTLCNLVTDLNLTDLETCYKAVRTRLLQSIPIRSSDFRMEIELTVKLAKRNARIFEVPISYAGRTYYEGKKIRPRDGILALGALLRWALIDDLYKPDEYGSNILAAMSEVPRFNRWMADMVRPHVGARVLEIGAGIGNLTRQLVPRERYTASDINPLYLDHLRSFAADKPYMDVVELDVSNAEHGRRLQGEFDTVVCLNVLEHIEREADALHNIWQMLAPGGVAIILVPQNPKLFGSLDEVLDHQRRYTRRTFRDALEGVQFQVERMFDFNRMTTPGWWLNGRLLRRRHFSKVQLKLVNYFTGLFRVLDHVLPWHGVSLVAVARKS
ncbi:MAG: glycosyltransferase [Gemmatimonadales bacterium]